MYMYQTNITGGKKGRNSKRAQQAASDKRKKLEQIALCRAGCVTTDFAMQNVLVQMGLPLLSVNGMTITSIKQWVLR